MEISNQIQVIEQTNIGEWIFRKGSERVLTPEIKSALENIASTGFRQTYSPQYPYWFQQETGFPSPIIRMDFSPSLAVNNPLMSIYEIESRPAGLGIMTETLAQTDSFKPAIQHLKNFFRKKIGVKVLPSVLGGEGKKDRSADTRIFSEKLNLPFFDAHQSPGDLSDYLLWVRGGIEDEENSIDVKELENVALAPVRDHGNKNYLLEMGLAKSVKSLSEVDFSNPFCLKPAKGSKSDSILIWDPDNKHANGVSTKTRIEKYVNGSTRTFLLQPYIEPELSIVDGKTYCLIYRVFAVLNLHTQRYELVGGVYTARPNLIVHGASDAIIGLVKV